MVSLGSYPDISLKDARKKREEARQLIGKGINPAVHRKVELKARANTFEALAEEWLASRKAQLSPSTFQKAQWMLVDLLGPYIGAKPIRSLGAPEVLEALRRIEARGRIETAHRTKQRAGQVFRYAIATGRAERDPTADLRGTLAPVVTRNRAAITEPSRTGELLRAIDGYRGQPGTETALKLLPLLFVRPGDCGSPSGRNSRCRERSRYGAYRPSA